MTMNPAGFITAGALLIGAAVGNIHHAIWGDAHAVAGDVRAVTAAARVDFARDLTAAAIAPAYAESVGDAPAQTVRPAQDVRASVAMTSTVTAVDPNPDRLLDVPHDENTRATVGPVTRRTVAQRR